MMTYLSLIFIGCAVVAAVVVIIPRVRAEKRLRAEKKREALIRAIKPTVDFYLKKSEPLNPDKNGIWLKNTGCGRAVDISINDFYHPEEKDWCFKFQGISRLDPGEERAVDFDFFAGAYEASNKTDLLWMFDPDHDHDFAAPVEISFSDTQGTVYRQTITIGEEKKKHGSRMHKLQLIQEAMSRR